MQQRTDKQTLGLAREMTKAVVAHIQGGESHFPVVRDVAAVMASGVKEVPPHIMRDVPKHPADRREVQAMARDAAVYTLWRVDSTVLAMDDYLLTVLSESPAELPTAAVKSLRFRNPLVVLTTPDLSDEETQYYREHIGIPLGAYVFGRWDEGQLLCSTNDDRFEDLGVMFVGFISTPEGMVLQTLRCTVPLGQEKTSVTDAVARTVGGFHFSEDLGEGDITRLSAWLRRYLTQVLHTVSYAGSNEHDADVYRPQVKAVGKSKKARRQRPDEVSEFVKLGSLLSRELRELKKTEG
ncbi:hypothetical protein [Streptomyces sp. NPDC091027]|uniref:hypothetical protein n=1 Tax=Streptomyces sp. NPDC091027 TaxID=3365971 RepID=UPI0038141786